jgi:hypothetical protein
MNAIQGLKIVALSLALTGLVAGCAGSSDRMDPPGAGMTAMTMDDGMFAGSQGHHAAGKAAVTPGMNGRWVLTLSDLEVDKVPDGHVYLTRDGDHMHGVHLGKLERFMGTVAYELPAGTDPANYDSVVIWCREFNVEIGRANLPKKKTM